MRKYHLNGKTLVVIENGKEILVDLDLLLPSPFIVNETGSPIQTATIKDHRALERIKRFSFVKDCEKDEVSTIGEFLPNTIKSIEKDLKALEIIKETDKEINDYLVGGVIILKPKTQEEYDLLKEVLLCQ